MPVRPFVAAIVGFVALIITSAVIAAQRSLDFGDLSDLLFGRAEAPLACAALAWGWLAAGLLSVAGFFAAFAEDKDERLRPRVPMGAPVALFLLSAGLLWLALGCLARAPAKEPLVAPGPADLDEALEGGEPPAEIDPPDNAPPTEDIAPAAAPPPPPPIESVETSLSWPYEYPRIRGSEVIGSPAMEAALAAFLPMDDPRGEARAMLCDKAWIAFTGSASEEGPPARNSARSRARARLASERALAWLDAHDECARPVVLGVDLGQHAPTEADDPGDTAYQRQVIVIGRRRSTPEERVTSLQALSEMQAFYSASRETVLRARTFRTEAAVFVHE